MGEKEFLMCRDISSVHGAVQVDLAGSLMCAIGHGIIFKINFLFLCFFWFGDLLFPFQFTLETNLYMSIIVSPPLLSCTSLDAYSIPFRLINKGEDFH